MDRGELSGMLEGIDYINSIIRKIYGVRPMLEGGYIGSIIWSAIVDEEAICKTHPIGVM